MTTIRPTLRCPCDGRHLARGFAYERRPEGEAAFPIAGAYRREYRRCAVCRHWFSHHEMDLAGLYSGAYVDATYGDRMRQTFERIMALPEDRSDNASRVATINDFARRRFGSRGTAPRLLDVGTGLAVFPARMKAAGWVCTALDPDPRAAAHARDVVGITALAGDFRSRAAADLGQFDLVSFNKVLEHVEDPVELLASSHPLLAPGGFVYLELPDAEAAAREGAGREEFFIEHHHVFSMASTALLAARAGFSLLALESLREPSGKFTIRAFLEAAPAKALD
ncbi:MAG TPA: class I SAM-dependent methyltransferase [Stellaceae bacterium]|nr:class I SAM-dependent methyltransferase [Stellaceae bacterium]